MSTMWQLSFPALNDAFSSMILFFAQFCTADEHLSSAGGHGYSSNTAHAFSRRFAPLLPPSPLPSRAPRTFSHLEPIYTAFVGCGRGNLHVPPVICCPVPGPMEKGKATALLCICTIRQA